MFSIREILLCASLGCGVDGCDLANDAQAVRKDELFSSRSLSSGHSKKEKEKKQLPIGIISPFVLLTSMKLPSLLTFVHLCFVFFMLYVVTILGVIVHVAQTLLLKNRKT